MENNIFQRHEIKFLVDSGQRFLLEQCFQKHMAPDPHGESKAVSAIPVWPAEALDRGQIRQIPFSRSGEADKSIINDKEGLGIPRD